RGGGDYRARAADRRDSFRGSAQCGARDSYAVRGMGDGREQSQGDGQGNLLARDCGDCRGPLFRVREWSEYYSRSLRRRGYHRGVARWHFTTGELSTAFTVSARASSTSRIIATPKNG